MRPASFHRAAGGFLVALPIAALALRADAAEIAHAELFRALVGPNLSVEQVRTRGSLYDRYENDFITYGDRHWIAERAAWEAANYYDRAAMYYAWYVRSGNETYFDRANQLALDYRVKYLEANHYGISPHWAQMRGVALHYAATGDPASLRAVGAVADVMVLPYYFDNLANPAGGEGTENRIQARVLAALLYAWMADAPSEGVVPDVPGGNNWPARLRTAVDRILSTQDADGAYRFPVWQNKVSPYMTGLLNDALIEDHTLFESDPRITVAIRKSLDYLWEHTWDATSQSFFYTEPGHPESSPAPDLNNLILNGFGWAYRMSGEESCKQRGDLVLAGAVFGAWLAGSKQFNQQYALSYKYLAFTLGPDQHPADPQPTRAAPLLPADPE